MCASKFSGDGYETVGKGIYYTPEISIWLEAKSTRANHRKVFFQKLANLREDIEKYQRPRRARAKIIPSVESPVYTIRLENNEGIRILFDYKSHTEEVEIFVIAVSNKKDFQSKLKQSSEHIVHASSFDRLPWDGEYEELDLENCTDDELKKFKERAKRQFDLLPVDEKTWTREKMESRTKRATIYDLCLPNVIDTETLNEDFLIPQILKLQDHQKELMDNQNNQFLLEGVAGTGKTTILLYRFVNDIKEYAKETNELGKNTLFVTHNKKLKDDILRSLRLFFPPAEIVIVTKCVKTIDELFAELISDKEEDTVKNKENKFPKERKLNRTKFRKLFQQNKIDIDLFWEEYRGILRGYNLEGDKRIISKEKYVNEIGRRRGKLQKSQREQFYYLAEEIESKLKESPLIDPQNGGWDDLDICKEIITRIQEKKIPSNLEYLYVDEVQDLTAAEIEVLLAIMNKNGEGKKRIAMAGDLSQSIQPSSFTWQALSDIIYDVLDIKANKHQTLIENYRSTPYLVWAANHILKLQSKLDGETTTELQRPFADENHGEPGLVFFNSEEQLIKQLTNNNLPNAACPMLVRNEGVKKNMQALLPPQNYPYVETIAKFKGLEKKNILLWQPDSGTDCELDLREDPNRGKEARKKEYSDSTALLELRHVFVGFTRARYLMGICAPKGDSSFFLKKAINDCDSNCIESADISKLALFDSEIEDEDLLEFAREYESAGQWGMAAEAFRNLGYEHEYHYNLGMLAAEEGECIESINSFSNACAKPGVRTSEARVKIAEGSSYALDEEMEKKDRSNLIAKILHNSEEQLSELQKNRLNGEKAEERGNWAKAANFYIDAGDLERARYCINYIENDNTKISFYIRTGDSKKAILRVKEFISKLEPLFAISIALGIKKALDVFFKKKELRAMRQHFENPNISWAMKIANDDSKLLQYIRTEKTKLLLKRKNVTRSQEYEVFKHLLNTKNIKELNRRKGDWKHLDNDIVTLEQFEIQKEKKYFLQVLQSIGKDWEHYETYLAKFKKLFPLKPNLGLSITTYFKEEKIKFEMKSDTELSQEIWTYSILAETINLKEYQHTIYFKKLDNEMFNVERKTSSMVSALLILLFDQKNPDKLEQININTLFSADIIVVSQLKNTTFTNNIINTAICFTKNHSKLETKKVRSAFNISLGKKTSIPKNFFDDIFLNCHIAMKNPSYNEMKMSVPYPGNLTIDMFNRVNRQVRMTDIGRLKELRKEWKTLSKYSCQIHEIERSDFNKIKTIKKLSDILKEPIFNDLLFPNATKKEKSLIEIPPVLEERPTDESIMTEGDSIQEEIIDDVENEILILDEVFEDIDFSEIISENSDESDEIIQFSADDITELNKDVKGEKHVVFFEEKLKESHIGDNMEYAKVLIDYSDFAFQSNCGLDLHLRFALMIAIHNEAKTLMILPEPIYIFQKSDEERRRLFMSEPRNKDAIIESGLNYSHRILNQNL